MYCPHCGSLNNDGSDVCQHCTRALPSLGQLERQSRPDHSEKHAAIAVLSQVVFSLLYFGVAKLVTAFPHWSSIITLLGIQALLWGVGLVYIILGIRSPRPFVRWVLIIAGFVHIGMYLLQRFFPLPEGF